MTNQSSIQVKICGMREVQNMLDVAALQPDFMGFIFYEKSPRYVGNDFDIPEGFPDTISRVGVFVNESTKQILELAERHALDYLQLHGDESVEQVKELWNSNSKIIKVFSVDAGFDFNITKSYQPYCDYFLFDTKGKHYGGNATLFDWNLLKKYDQKVPFFLSGGLNSDNVNKALAIDDLNLFALDLNSGVEISPGLKDAGKIRRVIDAIRKKRSHTADDII